MSNTDKIENLQDLIKETIGGEIVQQHVQPLLPPGENYGSVMYKVDFKVKKEGKEEEFHAVAKCTPLNPLTQELFNTQDTFKAEIAWYTTVIPTLKRFQKDHGVEREIDFFQKFYGARISLNPTNEKVDLDGVILTQNLKPLGYYNEDRHIGFDLPTTYTILRDLATFHAIPLAIRIQNPDLFNKNIKPYLPKFGEFGTMQNGFKNNILSVFDHIPEFESIMEEIKKYIDEAIIFIERPLREPWVTVNHRDFWINNIMITGGKNSRTMILDLQIPCLGSPVADLIFFLLTSVRLDVMQEKFDDFLQYYFDEFIRNLKELNVLTELFTIEDFFKEIEIEVKKGEFAHSLSHTLGILAEKGTTVLDSSDKNYKLEDFTETKQVVNKHQIKKYKWITSECLKRKWI